MSAVYGSRGGEGGEGRAGADDKARRRSAHAGKGCESRERARWTARSLGASVGTQDAIVVGRKEGLVGRLGGRVCLCVLWLLLC